MTRVCFILGNITPLLSGQQTPVVGGAEVQQYLIGRQLIQHGFSVLSIDEEYGQGPAFSRDGFQVLSFRLRRNKFAQGLSLLGTLAQANADVYYIRRPSRFTGMIALFCRLRRRPLVVGMASDRMVAPRQASGMGFINHLNYRLALNSAGAIVAQTETQRRQLGENFNLAEKVTVIHNGIELRQLPLAPLPPTAPALWIASIHPYKGVETLFELARRLPEQPFVAIGGPTRGNQAYYEQMQAQAAALPNLEWRGFVPHTQIGASLGGALALIKTPAARGQIQNMEGFPNIFLEAWERGVPVLTMNYDPDDLIRQHELGFCCLSVEDVAAHLHSLATNPALRQRLGLNARAYVEQQHNMDVIGDQYARLFSAVARAH